MILILDNYDSFIYNIWDYLKQLKTDCVVYRNDKISLNSLKKKKINGLVLSPGPGKPENAGIMMELIDYYHSKIPMLGICLGHQGIGQYFGGKLVKAQKPMHGKISLVKLKPDPVFFKIPSTINVVRYHSLLIEGLNNKHCKIIAETVQKENMAIAHSVFPVWGLQFHPEAVLTEYGFRMIKNWSNSVKRK